MMLRPKFTVLPAAAVAGTLLVLTVLVQHPQSRADDKDPPDPDKPAQPFDGRFHGDLHDKLVKDGGGTDESEAAVARGLLWLALHQAPDGHWSLHEFNKFAHKDKKPSPTGAVFNDGCTGQASRQNDVAGTAFGLLPFLAAGYTHKVGDKDARKEAADYAKVVGLGLDWLIAKQDKAGYFGADMYSHALAATALCEAYGMTSDPKLKAPAQKALNYIVSAQHDEGGWRYSPKMPGDLSVTGYMLTALRSGQWAGLDVPKAALAKAEKFVDSCEAADKGGFCYMPAGSEAPTMTAVGLLCLERFGANPRNPRLVAGVKKLQKTAPGESRNLYYDYYATQTLYNVGGDAWEDWNKGTKDKKGIRDILMDRQDKAANLDDKHACQDGSWAPEGPWGDAGGRVMSTSLSLLTLEVYYRHLPLYRRDLEKP